MVDEERDDVEYHEVTYANPSTPEERTHNLRVAMKDLYRAIPVEEVARATDAMWKLARELIEDVPLDDDGKRRLKSRMDG